MTISHDPATIPEKAKAGFSWREFGWISAEAYCRLNHRQDDDGGGARADMELDFNMWAPRSLAEARGEERPLAGTAFVAGWAAYIIWAKRG